MPQSTANEWFPTFSAILRGRPPLFPTFVRGWRWLTGLLGWMIGLRPTQIALLRLLVLCIENGLPLESMLMSFAKDVGGRQRNRIERVVCFLQNGQSLADAFESVPNTLPDDVVMAIRVGTETGMLTDMLTEFVDKQAVIQEERITTEAGLPLYLGIVLLFFALILTFVMIKIIPTYQKIFEGFQLELPAPLMVLISITATIDQYSYLLFLGGLIGLIAMVSGVVQRSARRGLLARFWQPWFGTQSSSLLRS